jgi:Protein of unknown function (DUF664)
VSIWASVALVGSNTTTAGLVKHLRVIEMNWFQRILAQTPEGDLAVEVRWDDYADSSFMLAPADTTASLVAVYRHQCELSRQIARDYQLSATVPICSWGPCPCAGSTST